MNRGLSENTKKGCEKTESLFASLHRSMISGEDAVLNAVVPLLKLLSITLFGSILAHPRVQIIPKATFKILSKLVFVLFLPCLIFNYLGPSITLENFVLWWFIPVNVVISTFIGIILGYLVTLICRPPPEFFRFTIIMTAFGNTGNVSLAIVSSICHNTTDNPFGTDCYSSGVAYVAFSQWVSVILVYTFVYHMMEPPLEYYDIVEEENSEIEIQEEPIDCLSRPLLVEAEWPGLDDKEPEHYKIPIIARLFKSISGLSHTTIPHFDSIEEGSGGPKSPKSLRCLAEPRMVRKMRIVAEHTPIRHILQPPVLASLLAILIGIIPGLKSITFGRDVPLAFITDSLEMMSEAAVPSVMLIIGGMLTEGPNESSLGNRTTIGIIVARLVVLPFIGIGVICLAEKWNFLVTGDQLYRFVIFLQYTTPSAILLGAMASLRGYAVSEASALLFWQHVFALFSLTLSIIIYFKLLYVYS